MNRRLFLPAIALAAAAMLAACGGGQPAAAPTAAPAQGSLGGNVDNGKAKFSTTCTSCHGPDAKGMTGLGKDLHNNQFVAGKTDVEMVEFLKKGRPASDPLNTTKVDMPPKGGNPALSDQDLADIVAFLRTLK
jgi:disulfide bond formation protein DsbB